MLAGFEQFMIIIQRGFFWIEYNVVFLQHAKSAEVGSWIEGCHSLHYTPLDCVCQFSPLGIR